MISSSQLHVVGQSSVFKVLQLVRIKPLVYIVRHWATPKTNYHTLWSCNKRRRFVVGRQWRTSGVSGRCRARLPGGHRQLGNRVRHWRHPWGLHQRQALRRVDKETCAGGYNQWITDDSGSLHSVINLNETRYMRLWNIQNYVVLLFQINSMTILLRTYSVHLKFGLKYNSLFCKPVLKN